MALFRERGFDAVTVADVARAADVSEKTVFNYFPAKEDLVFRRGAERRAELIEAIRALPPGASVVSPFRRRTDAFLDGVEQRPVDRLSRCPGSSAAARRCATGCSSAGRRRRSSWRR